jgi:hypothetical protein
MNAFSVWFPLEGKFKGKPARQQSTASTGRSVRSTSWLCD